MYLKMYKKPEPLWEKSSLHYCILKNENIIVKQKTAKGMKLVNTKKSKSSENIIKSRGDSSSSVVDHIYF